MEIKNLKLELETLTPFLSNFFNIFKHNLYMPTPDERKHTVTICKFSLDIHSVVTFDQKFSISTDCVLSQFGKRIKEN